MSKAPMKLALFMNATGHHQASWRHPAAVTDAGINLDHIVQVAKEAEAAQFDAIFLADVQAVRDGDMGAVSRVAQYVANYEPFTLLAALAVVTEKIGLIATATTSYNFPYQLARKLASIDFLSGGRVGWNMVTSGQVVEAKNFDRDEHYGDSIRYVRAAEFVEVCLGLWDSWEDDAFERDVESGVYFDPAKMHRLEHSGEYFKVRGPLNIPRSPQGRPLLVQAGASAAGVDFAARFADMVFVTPQNLEDGQEKYKTIKEAAASYGRDPEQIKVMPGLAVLPTETREEFDRQYAELQSLLADEVALNNLSMKLKTDVSGYPPDEPLPASVRDDANPVIFDQWMKISEEENLNLRELAVRASTSLAGHFVAGSGDEVADLMQDWFENEAADGFNIQPLYEPGAFTGFTKWVQPELRRRGLLGDAYQGDTLREHFGLPRPAWGEGWPDAKE